MRPLTDAERDLIVMQVCQSLARDSLRYQAKAIVSDLEKLAVSGATLKRACERVLTSEPTE